ncbi:hypothetical protein J2T08_003645 [Neorhizobium galegae]|uniref:hypothetical protein n=1 Tax=Neorhizobium galegae TaxID=399 RepID=UPI00278490C2|nr:hypothetical protein [Neorhizobium galegae]MDQ0135724.1 hypothetical protein [Neorhizobium galegae]
MNARIPCLNPNCRRTAAQEKYPNSSNIICGKCWKAMPAEFRRRWKTLKSRDRRLGRIHNKTAYRRQEREEQWGRIATRFDRAWEALDLSIIHYFTASEAPIGIEDFLKENGIV